MVATILAAVVVLGWQLCKRMDVVLVIATQELEADTREMIRIVILL